MRINFKIVIGLVAVYWLFFRKTNSNDNSLVSGGIPYPTEESI